MAAISEAEDIRKAVKRASLPDTVLDVSYRLDVDASGAPAVWVRVMVEDAVATSRDFPEVTARIRDAIRTALQQAGIERSPYVRFRTQSEEAELVGEHAK
jgi:hypothetical protein